jgi:Domain of unknown function (DUF4407)
MRQAARQPPAQRKDPPGAPVARFALLQRMLVTLGGARVGILEHAAVDAPEMTGRGIAALIPAVFGALAAAVAFGYAYTVPIRYAAPAGAAWGLVVLLFDISLMSASPGRGLGSRLVALGSRALVSVLAAFAFAGPLVLFMYGQDVATQVRVDQQADLATYNREHIVPKYAPAINADKAEIVGAQGVIRGANQAVAVQQRKVEIASTQVICEDGGVSAFAGCQQGTGIPGKGNVYYVRLSELQNAESNLTAAKATLKADKAQLGPQISSQQADITALQQQKQAEYATAQTRYLHNSGLIARWRALGELERAYPGVRTSVRLLEGLIIVVDLSAVIAKLSSKTPSYDRLMEAQHKKVTLQAEREEEAADDELECWRDERDAATDLRHAWLDAVIEVTREAIHAWVEAQRSRIRDWLSDHANGHEHTTQGEYSARQSSPPRSGFQGRRGTRGDTHIQGLSLQGFVNESRPHELMPVQMAPALARVAWIGIGLLAALALGLVLAHAAHVTVIGGWSVAPALAMATALAIYSHGFRRAPAWAHRATFGMAILALFLPVVIILLNI